MSKTKNLIVSCLNELSSREFKDTYESLVSLTNYLEEKNDPDPEEIEIVENTYKMIEKLKLLEAALRRKVGSIEIKSASGTLDRLWKKPTQGNTSTLF